MLPNEDITRLKHMLDYSREAVAFAHGVSRQDLGGDRMRQLAIVRLIEIIGEAATRVSNDTRERHLKIPWHQIIGTRNRLIHGYDFVDYDVLWRTVQEDLPELVEALKSVLGAFEE